MKGATGGLAGRQSVVRVEIAASGQEGAGGRYALKAASTGD